ncbi:MAG: helix-turn-helix transcriptional regulator [Clostridiales bacterium]|nr:helix-turn-helix transcriptional regulator [Clostridiales bacterium]
MIKLNALELLEKRGKTKYWLYKQLGMSYQNFSRMINNQTKSIRYENIEILCLLLNCTPNELFTITEDGQLKNQPSGGFPSGGFPAYKIKTAPDFLFHQDSGAVLVYCRRYSDGLM